MSLIDNLGRGFGVTTGEAFFPSISQLIDPESATLTGCRDAQQNPAYVVPSSFGVGLRWTVRDAAGNPIYVNSSEFSLEDDLTRLYDRVALFRSPFCSCRNRVYVGKILATGDGTLTIVPPSQVMRSPDIYHMEVYWTQTQGEQDVTYFQYALLSVEQNIMTRLSAGGHCKAEGPLQFSRIRNKLRDYAALNDTLGAQEYSIEELVSAMMEPVEYYNEMPPDVKSYSIRNFPYRQQWLDATVSRLLHTTGLWMMRNHVPINAEGVKSDERAKWQLILGVATREWEKYQDFVKTDKTRISMQRGFRII